MLGRFALRCQLGYLVSCLSINRHTRLVLRLHLLATFVRVPLTLGSLVSAAPSLRYLVSVPFLDRAEK